MIYSASQQVGTTLVMLGVLAIQYVLLLASGTVNRVLGETGTNVISRIMGLILAALSIETIPIGIRTAFALGCPTSRFPDFPREPRWQWVGRTSQAMASPTGLGERGVPVALP